VHPFFPRFYLRRFLVFRYSEDPLTGGASYGASMGIGVGLSSIPCILLPFAILKKRGKMPKLHWDIAALPGLLCGAGWELGFIAAVLSTMSPLGECATLLPWQQRQAHRIINCRSTFAQFFACNAPTNIFIRVVRGVSYDPVLLARERPLVSIFLAGNSRS
jgi:hypothetical protein